MVEHIEPDRDFPPRAGVCNIHFCPDCFSNLMEVSMSYSKVLKRNAVPNVAVPVLTSQQLHLLPETPLHTEVSV